MFFTKLRFIIWALHLFNYTDGKVFIHKNLGVLSQADLWEANMKFAFVAHPAQVEVLVT